MSPHTATGSSRAKLTPVLAAMILVALSIGLLAADPAQNPGATPPTTTQPRMLPNGSIAVVISKETTRFTGPLNPDGTVNYVEALDEIAREGVTKENNFAVVVLEVFGPATLSSKIKDRVLKRLELDLPDKGDYFQDYKEAGVANDDYFAAMTQPWREDQHPTVAKWLQANQKHLDRLAAEAKRCTHNYVPLVSYSDPPQALTMLVPSLGLLAATRDALRIRALIRFGSGDFAGARSDIDAIGYLSRRAAQQAAIISWLLGVGCEATACQVYQDIALSGRLSASQARAMLADMERWPKRAQLAPAVEAEERAAGLDAVMMLERGLPLESITHFDRKGGIEKTADDETGRKLQPIIADFNLTLTQFNVLYDALALACNQTTFAERRKAYDAWEKSVDEVRQSPEHVAFLTKPFWDIYKRVDVEQKQEMMTPVLAKALPAMMMPYMSAVLNSEAKIDMRFDLTRLTLALAAYHADKGEYPDKLDALAPAYIKTIPQDLFIEKPLHYQREGKGYLLYSVGSDMKDDGGDETKDLVVRAR